MNRKELKQAFKEGLISKQQFAEELVKLEEKPSQKAQKRLYEALSEEEFKKLLKATNKAHHKLCFILAYGSGLRISEVVNLKKEDIDLAKKKIFIRQAKGGKDRVVNIPKWLRESHLKYIPFKITDRAINKAFLSASQRAKINSVLYVDKKEVPRNRFHFHSLRHSYAVRLLEKGVPINHVQALLGHEDLSTTSKYTKANPQDAIKSVMELDV